MLDVSGKIIIEGFPNNNSVKLDVSKFVKGVYFICIQLNDELQLYQKVIIPWFDFNVSMKHYWLLSIPKV